MKNIFACLLLLGSAPLLWSQPKTLGRVHHFDPSCAQLVDTAATIEVLAGGFDWAEGPVWIKDGGFLLFSDVPKNTIYRWAPGDSLRVFLQPSGYTGRLPYSGEPGSNGLIVNQKGELVSCEHGDRRIAAMPLQAGGKRTLADHYQGRRFNSPNDIVQHPNGDYYFTDPPYGLPKQEKDPTRETRWFGVYRLAKDGAVSLVDSTLSRPNGAALSPDGRTLYVGQSDGARPVIMAYPVARDGSTRPGKVLFDATPYLREGKFGIFDGMKTDTKGNIFAAGLGGVLIITPGGKLIGWIETGLFTANCAWGDDGRTLYLTADMYLCRIRTRTGGW